MKQIQQEELILRGQGVLNLTLKLLVDCRFDLSHMAVGICYL